MDEGLRSPVKGVEDPQEVPPVVPQWWWVGVSVYDDQWRRTRVLRRKDKTPRLWKTADEAYWAVRTDTRYGKRWRGMCIFFVTTRAFRVYWENRRKGQPAEEGGSEAEGLQAWYDAACEALARSGRVREVPQESRRDQESDHTGTPTNADGDVGKVPCGSSGRELQQQDQEEDDRSVDAGD